MKNEIINDYYRLLPNIRDNFAGQHISQLDMFVFVFKSDNIVDHSMINITYVS